MTRHLLRFAFYLPIHPAPCWTPGSAMGSRVIIAISLVRLEVGRGTAAFRLRGGRGDAARRRATNIKRRQRSRVLRTPVVGVFAAVCGTQGGCVKQKPSGLWRSKRESEPLLTCVVRKLDDDSGKSAGTQRQCFVGERSYRRFDRARVRKVRTACFKMHPISFESLSLPITGREELREQVRWVAVPSPSAASQRPERYWSQIVSRAFVALERQGTAARLR